MLVRGKNVVTIEVKSGRRDTCRGHEAFSIEVPVHRHILVGSEGVPGEEFLCTNPEKWTHSNGTRVFRGFVSDLVA